MSMCAFVEHVAARKARSLPRQSADPSGPFILQLGLLLLQSQVMSSASASTLDFQVVFENLSVH